MCSCGGGKGSGLLAVKGIGSIGEEKSARFGKVRMCFLIRVNQVLGAGYYNVGGRLSKKSGEVGRSWSGPEWWGGMGAEKAAAKETRQLGRRGSRVWTGEVRHGCRYISKQIRCGAEQG